MPNAVPITLTDAEAVPVDHVFNPIKTGDQVIYREAGQMANIEQRVITYSFSPPNANRSTTRIRFGFADPKVVTDVVNSNALSVLGTARFGGEFIIPDSFTYQDKANLYSMCVDLINDLIFKDAVEQNDPPF